MGMTFDDAISDLTELKICGVVPFTKGTISGGNYKVITGDCLDVAVDTMRKYQKIEKIIANWKIYGDIDSYDCIADIYEVLESEDKK